MTQARNRIILDQEKYALGLKQILVDKPRRSELKQSTTPQETSALRASNGKVAWINKTRMDVASRLSGVQQEVTTATVSTIHEHNKLVVQCVRDSFLTLEFVPVRFWDDDFGTLAVSDSSFMNALEDESAVQPGDAPMKIDCQQGFVSVVGSATSTMNLAVFAWRTWCCGGRTRAVARTARRSERKPVLCRMASTLERWCAATSQKFFLAAA